MPDTETLPMKAVCWMETLPHNELAADDVTPFEVGGRELALYAVGAAVYATDSLCTHGLARLCDGFLEGHEIECPLHQGRFDVRTGKALCAEAGYPQLSGQDRKRNGVRAAMTMPHADQE